MTRITLTAEQIVREIEDAFQVGQEDKGESYTFKELRALMGVSHQALYRRLDILEENNRLRLVSKMVETRGITSSGSRVWRPVTAYQILSEAED